MRSNKLFLLGGLFCLISCGKYAQLPDPVPSPPAPVQRVPVNNSQISFTVNNNEFNSSVAFFYSDDTTFSMYGIDPGNWQSVSFYVYHRTPYQDTTIYTNVLISIKNGLGLDYETVSSNPDTLTIYGNASGLIRGIFSGYLLDKRTGNKYPIIKGIFKDISSD